MKTEKHLFAIYIEHLSEIILNLKKDKLLRISDKEFHKRITKVLRLSALDHIILFDNNINLEVIIDKKTFEQKKEFVGTIVNTKENKKIFPEIIFCPSVLKKNFFQDVFYIASQMGVNRIIPLVTEKCQRSFGGEKELEKLKKIMISAAEQSKDFCIPEIQEPVLIKNFLENSKKEEAKKIAFEVGGKNLLELLNDVSDKKFKKIFVAFGPEGGFTSEEVNFLNENYFEVYNLTPTVLRAVEAVCVGLGAIRSMS